MSRCFQVYNYPRNLKPRISIFHVNGKDSIQRQETKTVNEIRGSKLNWKLIKKHFRQKYLTKRHYDKKAKEFHDLELGQMCIEDF